ncbi:leucine-rich repeat-containing protein 51 isoform X2 [Amblyraja radiata]|uniref:leucine-rich repeat-containing protein 51 isoform X2 n=1 Tax=Amblyraja radiata TaxID=386614 RepID=UPI001403D823|nr:leucine-rich repeat-containing protein 51 isoform X2 [Amblyraja radiata]
MEPRKGSTDSARRFSAFDQSIAESSVSTAPQPRTVNTKEYDSILYGPVVDYSFRSLDSVHDAIKLTPRTGVKPNEFTEDRKMKSCSLRLSHNRLNDLSGLKQLIDTLLVEPRRLFWIDLSFNNFDLIDPVLILCIHLQVLNMHGNQVAKLYEVDKLAVLAHLRSLTLHGNPVELLKGYRSYIVGMIPQLKSLDYSTITKQDRSTAAVMKSFTRHKRPARRRYDE